MCNQSIIIYLNLFVVISNKHFPSWINPRTCTLQRPWCWWTIYITPPCKLRRFCKMHACWYIESKQYHMSISNNIENQKLYLDSHSNILLDNPCFVVTYWCYPLSIKHPTKSKLKWIYPYLSLIWLSISYNLAFAYVCHLNAINMRWSSWIRGQKCSLYHVLQNNIFQRSLNLNNFTFCFILSQSSLFDNHKNSPSNVRPNYSSFII